MREIKFRGKVKTSIEELNELGLKHEKGWVVGNLVMYGKTPYIVGDFIEVDAEYTVNEFWVEVIPDTVGQFVGLKDKNGKEIYEGDIFRDNDTYLWEVFFEDGMFCAKGGEYDLVEALIEFIPEHCEIIGNIYENPELLEVEGEKNEICPTCNGSGGFDVLEYSIGEIVTVPCSDCGGSGKTTDVARQALESDEN